MQPCPVKKNIARTVGKMVIDERHIEFPAFQRFRCGGEGIRRYNVVSLFQQRAFDDMGLELTVLNDQRAQ